MKVLVFGASGYIGTNLIRSCKDEGCRFVRAPGISMCWRRTAGRAWSLSLPMY